MDMHIPILTGVQNVRISRWRIGHILIKLLLLKLIFQNEGHLYGNCLFYILPIYCKFLLFQFLSSVNLTFLKNCKKRRVRYVWHIGCQITTYIVNNQVTCKSHLMLYGAKQAQQAECQFVRPKIRRREKHQGNMGNTKKNWGKNRWNIRKRRGKLGKHAGNWQ